MKRVEFIRIISELAGPIGPLGTIENRDTSAEDWYNTFDEESIDVMIDLLINPPEEKELGYEIPEYFEVELNNALIAYGKKHSRNLIEKIYILDSQPIRSNVIYVVGGIRAQEGLPYLDHLLEKDDLSEDDILEIIAAVAQIGGDKAIGILEKMKAIYVNKFSEAVKQIEIWLKHI